MLGQARRPAGTRTFRDSPWLPASRGARAQVCQTTPPLHARRRSRAATSSYTLSEDIDIAFSTHLNVVVPVRVEFACGRAPREVDLVIARHQCRDRRPRLQALCVWPPDGFSEPTARGFAAAHPAPPG